MVESVTTCLGEKRDTFEDILESEKTLVQLIAETNSLSACDCEKTPAGIQQPMKEERSSFQNNTKSSKSIVQTKKISREAKAEKRRKALKVMNKRRRQRKRGGVQSSSDEEEEEEEDTDSSSSGEVVGYKETILPPEHLGEDIDLQMIESLSDSSDDSRDEENKYIVADKKPVVESSPNPPGTKSRRNIVLAANFSLPGPTTSPRFRPKEQSSSVQQLSNKEPTWQHKATPTSLAIEEEIKKLSISTDHQELVHKALLIGSKEKYLCCIKVFSDWLQSYPAVLASYGKVEKRLENESLAIGSLYCLFVCFSCNRCRQLLCGHGWLIF